MNSVQLQPNSGVLRWRAVTWTPINQQSPLVLLPGEAWYDHEGCVRFFSVDFGLPNIRVKNFKLLPRDQTTEWVLNTTSKWFVDLGLQCLGDSLGTDDFFFSNIALTIAQSFASITVKDYLKNMRKENLAYFDVESGREWFAEVLYI